MGIKIPLYGFFWHSLYYQGDYYCQSMGLGKRKACICILSCEYFDILLCLRISIKLPQSRNSGRNLQCDDIKRSDIFILLHCIIKDDQILQNTNPSCNDNKWKLCCAKKMEDRNQPTFFTAPDFYNRVHITYFTQRSWVNTGLLI